MVLLEDVREFLTRHSIEGVRVLVAVSGGIDSMALLSALSELDSEFDLELHIAHLDHGLRGKSSAEDAEFVRSKVKKLNLPFVVDKRPVDRKIKGKRQSLEEAARSVRYDFLDEVARKKGADFVALGHNRNDQAETILMHVIRGAGLRGLGGMEELKSEYIRPLLRTSRDDIVDYAKEVNLDYRLDKTNKDTSFTRNRIRHDLIPTLKEEYNPGVMDSLIRLGDIARRAQSFIEKNIDDVLDELLTDSTDKKVCFTRRKLLELHPHLQRAVLRKLVQEFKGTRRDIAYHHIEELVDKLREEPASTSLDLPGVKFSLDRDRACFSDPGERREPAKFSYEVYPDQDVEIEESDLKINFEVREARDKKDKSRFSSNRLIEAVDWHKVERPIYVRNRSEGDRFVPLGMDGQKKIKDFFIDLKVPLRERNQVPLVCDETGIIWVVGYRIDDRYKIDDKTDVILLMEARKL